MKKLLVLLGFAALAMNCASALAQAGLQVEQPWARATVPGASIGGGYLVIRNRGAAADRLIGATSPVASRVEIHEMAMEKDIMRMREVKGVDVPAKGAVEFKPGGYHLMFMELKAPLKQGAKVPVTLRFAKAGEVKADFSVEAVGAAGPGGSPAAGHGAMKH